MRKLKNAFQIQVFDVLSDQLCTPFFNPTFLLNEQLIEDLINNEYNNS